MKKEKRITRTLVTTAALCTAALIGIMLLPTADTNALDSNDDNPLPAPVTGGYNPVTKTIQDCADNGFELSYTTTGGAVCGTTPVADSISTPPSEWADPDNAPDGVKTLWNIANVCQTVNSNGKITFKSDGSIDCGGIQIGSWEEVNGDLSALMVPMTGGDPSDDSGNSSSGTITDEERQLINQLRSLIDQIKSDPLFQYYQRLIAAVKAAEDLLNKIVGSATTNHAVSTPKPDQPYVTNTIAARQASATLTTTTNDQQDLAAAIKEIGDAMRELGIKTNLGQGSSTPTAADLRDAIQAAKNTTKYTAYVALIQALEAAEAALNNGTATTATLTSLRSALTTATATDDATTPDTGIIKQADSSMAAATIATTALTVAAVIATAVGAPIIAYRQIKRRRSC